MKLVTFSKPMAPHGVGDTRLVSDKVAAELHGQGVISDSEPWPPAPAKAAHAVRGPKRPERPVVTPERPAGQLDLRVAE